MDNLVALYTTTNGRISRKTFWIGLLGLVVVNLIISFLILPLVGLAGVSAQALTEAAGDPTRLAAIISGSVQASAWASLVLLLIFAFPIYAIMVKRRHDRDNNGLDIVVYLALLAILLLIQALGFAYTLTETPAGLLPMPTMIFSILGGVIGIYAIYVLVVCGVLKGTVGPNTYGPDPLDGTAAAVA